nr:site-specific integrase [uncultured Mogibacterium sp.]
MNDINVGELSPRFIQQWIDKLAETDTRSNGIKHKYSPKTIRSTYSVLSRCCSIAVLWDILPSNPCHDVIVPNNTRKSNRILTPSELAVFINNLDTLPKDSKVLFELALFCSLRHGEVLAIEDAPIGNRILIDKARYRSKDGTDFIKEPKTSSGKRYCSVPGFVQQDISDLREYHANEKKCLGAAWINSKYLIRSEDGSPLSPQAVNKRLTKYVQRIGIEHINYHQLRHTYTSIVASEGTDLVTLSRLMCHSNKSTTLNIYIHLFKDENYIGQSVANNFDDMFKNIKNSHEKVTK